MAILEIILVLQYNSFSQTFMEFSGCGPKILPRTPNAFCTMKQMPS